jgi:hypothetical protein
MQQEDYIKRQIDQLGKVLGLLLANLMGLKNQGNPSDSIEISNKILKSELSIDIDGIMVIPNDQFISTLKENRALSNQNLNQLSEILFLLAENAIDNNIRKNTLYEKCLIILEYIELTENAYSMDRHFKIDLIKSKL